MSIAEMAGAEKNAALAFWKETMEYERMLPRIGYPSCEELPNRPWHAQAQRLTQTVLRSHTSPNPPPPTRN